MNYQELSQRIEQSGHGLCIGIDPDPAQFPEGVGGIREFCLGIIDATADVAVAYKPNFAFFEALGRPGWDALEAVTEHLRALPQKPFLIELIATSEKVVAGNFLPICQEKRCLFFGL